MLIERNRIIVERLHSKKKEETLAWEKSIYYNYKMAQL